MADFIFRANIVHFEHLLAAETDVNRVAVLHRLLAEEKAKLADFDAKTKKPNAAE